MLHRDNTFRRVSRTTSDHSFSCSVGHVISPCLSSQNSKLRQRSRVRWVCLTTSFISSRFCSIYVLRWEFRTSPDLFNGLQDTEPKQLPHCWVKATSSVCSHTSHIICNSRYTRKASGSIRFTVTGSGSLATCPGNGGVWLDFPGMDLDVSCIFGEVACPSDENKHWKNISLFYRFVCPSADWSAPQLERLPSDSSRGVVFLSSFDGSPFLSFIGVARSLRLPTFASFSCFSVWQCVGPCETPLQSTRRCDADSFDDVNCKNEIARPKLRHRPPHQPSTPPTLLHLLPALPRPSSPPLVQAVA